MFAFYGKRLRAHTLSLISFWFARQSAENRMRIVEDNKRHPSGCFRQRWVFYLAPTWEKE
jgi:hypothetical protein